MGPLLLLAGLLLAPLPAGASGAAQAFDHGAFDRLLRSHAHEDGVDYAGFAGPELQGYLASLATADPEALPPDEQAAFWINAYNAYTIDAVVRHRPASSIREIRLPGRDGQPGEVWKAPSARVGGRTLTLDEIEHDVLRKRWAEPRVHYALVCAAWSCPPLRNEAYVGARLEAQLEDQSRRFLHGKARGCRVDAAHGVAYLSEIFTWYRADFGDEAALVRHIARYLPASRERQALESGRLRLATIPFDWRLNARGNGPAPTGEED